MAKPRTSRFRAATTPGSEARSTREQLVELAAEVFAAEGYASASVRDLARRVGATSGALYGNFRGKADLLAAAVDAHLTEDVWSLPDDVVEQSLSDVVTYQFARYRSREQLMSLLLEGALASRADSEVRQQLHDTIGERLSASSRAFRSRREAEGFDPSVNVDAVVKILWSIEIGMRALSALGLQTPTQKDAADVIAHFMQGLQASPVKASPATARPAKAVTKPAVTKPAVAKKAVAKKAVAKKAPARKRAVRSS